MEKPKTYITQSLSELQTDANIEIVPYDHHLIWYVDTDENTLA